MLKTFFCVILLAAAGFSPEPAGADTVADDARGLGSIQQHRIYFFVPPESRADLTDAEVRSRLGKIVEDLNVVFAHQTIRRFTFNPNLDVYFVSTYQPSGMYPASFVTPNMLKQGYEIAVSLNPFGNHSSMTFQYDGSTHVSWVTTQIRDRDNPGVDPTGQIDYNAYWNHVIALSHEILHGFGGGGNEYYLTASKNDDSGVAPLVDISNIGLPLAPTTLFWEERSDYWSDPLLLPEHSAATIDERLDRTRFAELTVANANGRMRPNVFGDLVYMPDLAQTTVSVTGPDGSTPVVGATVLAWQSMGGTQQPLRSTFSGVTAADGTVELPWIPDATGQVEPLLLVKVLPTGNTLQPAGRWFSVNEAEEEFLLRGRTLMKLNFALEESFPAPQLTQIAPFQSTEDAPFALTHAALLAASDASDPQGLPIRFRVERFAAGALTKNGQPVAVHATLLGPGEQLVWTPPANRHDRDFPALVVRAHNGHSSSGKAVAVRVALAPTPDGLRAPDRSITLAEDSSISFEVVVDDPDGGPIPDAVVTSQPFHGQLTVTSSTNHYAIFTYTPEFDYFGTDKFGYVAQRGGSTSSQGTVNLTVTPVNDAPVMFTTPNLSGVEDIAQDIRVAELLASTVIYNRDGRPLSIRVTELGGGSLTSGGVAVATGALLSGTAVLNWQPPANATGSQAVFSFELFDGVMASTTANPVTAVLGAVNDAPTFNAIANTSMSEDTVKCVPVSGVGPGGGADEAGQSLTLSVSSSNSALVPNLLPYLYLTGSGASRCVNVVPMANAVGSTTITLTATDNGGGSTNTLTRAFTVTVTNVNDAPTYAGGSGTFTSNGVANWVRLFPDLAIDDADSRDPISCQFSGGLPSNVEITTASGSHTSVSASTWYALATFKTFWIVKHSIFSGGSETRTFQCKDGGGATTGAISYTVVGN